MSLKEVKEGKESRRKAKLVERGRKPLVMRGEKGDERKAGRMREERERKKEGKKWEEGKEKKRKRKLIGRGEEKETESKWQDEVRKACGKREGNEGKERVGEKKRE